MLSLPSLNNKIGHIDARGHQTYRLSNNRWACERENATAVQNARLHTSLSLLSPSLRYSMYLARIGGVDHLLRSSGG